jgi:hypothetical protein
VVVVVASVALVVDVVGEVLLFLMHLISLSRGYGTCLSITAGTFRVRLSPIDCSDFICIHMEQSS